MKNRPLLITALAAVTAFWVMYQTMGGIEGIRREPTVSLPAIGIMVLIIIPVFWFQYQRMKREPIYVEVQNRAVGLPADPRLGNMPLVLVASRMKILKLLTVGTFAFALVLLMMWRDQVGVCRTVGIASWAPYIFLSFAMSVVALLKPERLEITPQGLKHVSFWGSRLWPWDEIRNITVIKSRVLGSTGICFNRFVSASSRSDGPARPMFRPIWPVDTDELANLLNDARVRWSSPSGSAFVPARRRVVDQLSIVFVLVPLGIMLWLLLGHPCGA